MSFSLSRQGCKDRASNAASPEIMETRGNRIEENSWETIGKQNDPARSLSGEKKKSSHRHACANAGKIIRA
jgi:hypothetical protein